VFGRRHSSKLRTRTVRHGAAASGSMRRLPDLAIQPANCAAGMRLAMK
jgi:hypothetical protein